MTSPRIATIVVLLATALALGGCGRAERGAANEASRADGATAQPSGAAPPPEAAAPPAPTPPPIDSLPSKTPPKPSPPPLPSNAAAANLPAFPWPPPRFSAFSRIDRQWVAGGERPTLGSAAQRLEEAFDAAGYGERSYYWVPDGFALVSRLEQIRPDATPIDSPARWSVDTPAVSEGFLDHIRALFNAPPGFYRVIVFVVTDQDFSAGERAPTSSEARTWISSGALRLPSAVAAQPYGDQHYTTALVYEFERRANEPAHMTLPSGSTGRVHLERAGLWRALARR